MDSVSVWRFEIRDATSSYLAVRADSASWSSVVEGGARDGRRYFCGSGRDDNDVNE